MITKQGIERNERRAVVKYGRERATISARNVETIGTLILAATFAAGAGFAFMTAWAHFAPIYADLMAVLG